MRSEPRITEYVQPELPIVLTVPEAAKILYVSEDTILRYIRDGDLPASDVGRGRPRYRIAMSEIARFRRDRMTTSS